MFDKFVVWKLEVENSILPYSLNVEVVERQYLIWF